MPAFRAIRAKAFVAALGVNRAPISSVKPVVAGRVYRLHPQRADPAAPPLVDSRSPIAATTYD
jgi:hypothetical protein